MAWKMGQSLLGSFLLLLVCSQRFQLTRASWKDNNHHFCMNLTPIHLQQWKAECKLVRSPGWRFVIMCAISYSVTPVCNCVSESGSSEKQEWSGTGDLEAISASLCVCVNPGTRVRQGAWGMWAWQELWDISRIAFFLAVLSEMTAGWLCIGFYTLCQ